MQQKKDKVVGFPLHISLWMDRFTLDSVILSWLTPHVAPIRGVFVGVNEMQYGSIPPEAIPEDIATHYGEYTDPLDMLKELSKSLQKSSNSFMNDLYMERYIDDVQEANWEGALLMLRVIDVVVRYCIDRAENQKTKH